MDDDLRNVDVCTVGPVVRTMDYGEFVWAVHGIDTVDCGQHVLVGDDWATTTETAIFEQANLVGKGGLVRKIATYYSLIGWWNSEKIKGSSLY